MVQATSQGMCDIMNCEQATAAPCHGMYVEVLLTCCRAHHEQHHITMTCASKYAIAVETCAIGSISA